MEQKCIECGRWLQEEWEYIRRLTYKEKPNEE